MRTFLTCHSFQIRPKGKPEDFLKFNELPGTNKSFRHALTLFLEQTKSPVIDGSACHRIDKLIFEDDDGTIHGTFVTGDYGHSSQFIDVHSEENTFERTPDDAEQIPYYFLFSFADDGDKGILITQRMGTRGIQTALRQIIHSYLSNIFGVMIEFNDLIPTEVYDYLKKGEPKEVVFKHAKLPRDQINLLGWENISVDEIATVQIVVRAKHGQVLPLLNDELKDRYTSIVEKRVDDSASGIKNINIEINYGGGKRRVHLDQPDALSPLIDISKEVLIDSGVPDYDAVLAQSRLLLIDAKSKLNI